MTQNAKVLKHLQDGNTITPLSAIGVFGIFRLAARIDELRNAGYDIVTMLRYDANGKQYAEYLLRKPLNVGAKVQVQRGQGFGLPKWIRKTAAATVVEIKGDVANVMFRRGTKVETVWMNQREVVCA